MDIINNKIIVRTDLDNIKKKNLVINVASNKINLIELYDIIDNKIPYDLDYTLERYGKLLARRDIEIDLYDRENYINLNARLRGGLLDGILKALMQIFELVKLLLKAIPFLIKLLIWGLQFALWFIIDFMNPITLFSDLLGGIMKVTRLVVIGIFDIIMGILKYGVNNIISPVVSNNLMGWDSDISSSKKDKFKDTASSKCDDKDKEKCYKTKPGEVPLSILVATILCPPVGVFMTFGLSYWLNIIFCGVLTLLFYFPGLFYGLIMLYT